MGFDVLVHGRLLQLMHAVVISAVARFRTRLDDGLDNPMGSLLARASFSSEIASRSLRSAWAFSSIWLSAVASTRMNARVANAMTVWSWHAGHHRPVIGHDPGRTPVHREPQTPCLARDRVHPHLEDRSPVRALRGVDGVGS